MATLREKFVAALVNSGERQVESKSDRYLTFTRADGGFYFVGFAGALRFGKNSSTSIPCSDQFKNKLLESVEQVS